MRVPLDYDRPTGPLIEIALIRHPAEDQEQRVGSLLWNAGGPGGAPTEALPATYGLFPAGVRQRYDIVSFDPRGIGRSTPLRCFDSYADQAAALAGAPAGFPVGREEVARAVETNRRLTESCRRNGGPIQFHMSTANVARDMDVIRGLVGEDTLDYWGPSYGSYLGATYANLFPERVGRMVLDGNVPPRQWNDTRSARRSNTFRRIGSPQGAVVGLRMLLDQCGAVNRRRCAFSAGHPARTRAKYTRLLTRLKREPAVLVGVPFSYPLTVTAVNGLLSSQNPNGLTPGWKTVAAFMQTLWRASGSGGSTATVPRPVRRLVRGLADTEPPTDRYPVIAPEGIYGVLCSDSPNPRDPSAYLSRGRGPGSDTYGLDSVWSWLASPCASWAARDEDAYAGPWDRGTPPILVIGTLGDPNTAYSGSRRMARQLDNAHLLTEAGGGHTALLNRSTCIDDHVVAYYASGALPPSDTVCPQDRPPF